MTSLKEAEEEKFEEEEPLLMRDNIPYEEWTARDKINDFVENNGWFVTMITVCILVSCGCFILESEPVIAHAYVDTFITIELIIVTIFVFELFARFFTTRESMYAFFSSFMNWIDIVAVLPTVMAVTTATFKKDVTMTSIFHQLESGDDTDLRFLRLFRLIRLLKVGRHAFEFQVVGTAIKQSASAIFILFLMLAVTTLAFASLIMVVERGEWDEKQGCFTRIDGGCSPFQSIPSASWWVIVTTTTVGYGDSFPLTAGGKIIAALTMVSGILILALLTTVIGIQFTDNYYTASDDLRLEAARREYGFTLGKVFWPLLRRNKAHPLHKHEREAIERSKGFAVLKDDIDQVKSEFEDAMADLNRMVEKATNYIQVVQKQREMTVDYAQEMKDTVKVAASIEGLVKQRLSQL